MTPVPAMRERTPEFDVGTLLPVQFRDVAIACTPERRLMVAVLEDAVVAATKGFTDALDWFDADEEAWLFSFLGICDVLELDPEAVRAAVVAKVRPVRRNNRVRGTRTTVGGRMYA
jgi:hypothetical protein